MVKNIMLVDDNKIDLFINHKVIQKFDACIQVSAHQDASSALNYFKVYEKNKQLVDMPDMVLLDINMPGMDGFQFLEKFKKLPRTSQKKIYVFMLSSSAFPHDIQRAELNPNCSGYITKPLTVDKIKTAIDELDSIPPESLKRIY